VKDERKTKARLIEELQSGRRHIATLEAAERQRPASEGDAPALGEERSERDLDSLLGPEEHVSADELSTVLDLPAFQSLFEAFTEATGLVTALLDLDGEVLVATGWIDICSKFHRSHPETAENCRESDLYLAGHVKPGEFAVYKCKNNLWDVVTPLVIGERHLGNIYTGQFFYDDDVVDLDAFSARAARCGFDRNEYLSALESVPRVSREKVAQAMRLLVGIVTSLAELAYANLKLAQTVSKRRETEEALRTSQAMIGSILDSVPQAIFWKDLDGVYLGCNQQFARTAGVTSTDEILGKTDDDLPWRGGAVVAYRADDLEVIRERRPKLHIIESVPIGDGKEIWVDTSKVPLLDPSGRAYGVLGIFDDVTERRRSEEALRDSEEQLAKFMDSASDGFVLLDSQLNIALVNKAAGKVFRQAPEEAVGKNIEDVVPNIRESGRYQAYLEVQRTGVPFAMEDETPHPVFGDIRLSFRAFKVGDGVGVITTDVTERVQAEEALRDSEARLRSIFESSPLGIVLADAVGRIVAVNPAFCGMLGYSEGEILGHSSTDLTHAEDREETGALQNSMAEGETSEVTMEKLYLAKDGRIVWVRVTTATVIDEEGGSRYSLALVEDIRARREMEEDLRRHQSQLRALAARLEAVREEERRGIARELHDVLGQALTSLRMDLRLIESEPPPEEEWRSRMDELVDAVDGNIDLVRDLSARLRPPILDVMGLAAALDWQADRDRGRTSLAFHLDLDPGPLALSGEEETAAFRIVQEAITNVHRHAQATEVWIRLMREPGGVVLEIQDDGVGIQDDALQQLTSLGLVGMRERAAALGGRLTFEALQMGGTLVRLSIFQQN